MYKLILILIIGTNGQQQPPKTINLAMMKSSWQGFGVGHLLPGTLKILSSRLSNQVSTLSTYSALPGGPNWILDYTLKTSCQKYDDYGIVVQISDQSRQVPRIKYSYKNFGQFFGMNPNINNSVVILHRKSQLNIGYFNKTTITKEDLLYKTKPCKIYENQEGKVMIRIKYSAQDSFTVYSVEYKTGEERLCIQLNNVSGLRQFFMGISGADNGGNCFAEITNLNLIGEQPYQVVNSEDKKPGDNYIAYFDKSQKEEQLKNSERFEQLSQYMREDMKVVAKELLEFADKNEKEMINDFQSNMDKQSEKIGLALEIIEKEAAALQALGNYASSDKQKLSEDLGQMFDQILQWLDQMDSSFNEVDKQTQSMFESISNIGITEKMEEMISKSEGVVAKLSSILKKSKLASVNNPVAKMKKRDFDKWINNINDLGKQSEQFAEKSHFDFSSGVRIMGLGLLGIVSLVILFGFGYVYWKIQKSINQKRIL